MFEDSIKKTVLFEIEVLRGYSGDDTETMSHVSIKTKDGRIGPCTIPVTSKMLNQISIDHQIPVTSLKHNPHILIDSDDGNFTIIDTRDRENVKVYDFKEMVKDVLDMRTSDVSLTEIKEYYTKLGRQVTVI